MIKKYAIFGAQGYAIGAYEAMRELYPERDIICFLVSEIGINPTMLGGLPVRMIKDLSAEERMEISVFIATPENVQDEIASLLDESGVSDYVRLDSEAWAELEGMYHRAKGDIKGLYDYPVGDVESRVQIYVAKHHGDTKLRTTPSLPRYTRTLQVGAVNCSERIADLADDAGDNISQKNPNYSELTGLYWIWKNVLNNDNDYIGLAQYRRMLILSDKDISRLSSNGIDVVLPYPLPYEPDINEHHKRYIKDADWQALLSALEELQPEYARAFHEILSGRYLYNYNVILARREVLSGYCAWLFPILERVEELSDPKGTDRTDRYIGYMGETLETLYFMYNSDRLKITHAGCRTVA